jgi:N-6 DNA Methylase/Eco57I restriction-modification methylase
VTAVSDRHRALAACLGRQRGRYEELSGSGDFGAYARSQPARADEEILTEPLLAQIIEDVLGFPTDAYFPQLGRGGQKPDFTPIDLIAHPFIFDAKASDEDLGRHEAQIRRYMTQRSLTFGVLFNLREIRVYKAGFSGHDAALSFRLLPLWEVAQGEALPGPELAAFEAFCDHFSYRELTVEDKIDYVRRQPLWSERLAREEDVEVDVEALVDRLRRLSRLLADDAAAQHEQLDGLLRLNPARRRKLVEELELLALDVAPGTDIEQLPKMVAAWRVADGLPGRVWRQYLLRVAYLALTRILLYRAWEDVEFVPSYLYDGGFDDAYERLSRSVREVLREAFKEGAERYRWLYGADNNYDWYRPREAALVEVIYLLGPIPLGKLDADVLGGLYVSYVDEIDRDRLGQFFTPRAVVRFMLDRAGFRGREGVFRVEGDERRPVRLLDFATGSGGFLVEAARRIIDDGGVDPDDPRELLEALAAISRGFVGGEISPFPYYLTEVNLLLQVSRLLGQLKLAGADPPRFVLGALHVDTLTAKSTPAVNLEGIDPSLRADHGELVRDERFDLVPLDGEKLETYRELKEDESFDLVVGNPPYVTEANNKPLFDRLRAISAWKGIYRGKTDYSYYFLLLALEKLAPGGRLCVIAPASWTNAARAAFLRERLATELRLEQLFLFGSYRLFADDQGPAPTPLVESAILVATKGAARKRDKLRVVVLENLQEAGYPSRAELLAEMAARAAGRAGRRRGIHVHDVRHSALVADRPWPIKVGERDLAARLVTHLDALLDAADAPVEPLSESWKVFMGIETGADSYTRRIRKRLPPDLRARIEASGVQIGDPILQLPPGAEKEEPWRNHPETLARAPEATAVLYAAADSSDYTHYVRLDHADSPPQPVLDELEKWRPVLSRRAEIARNPRRSWWETAWPRNTDDLARPKVIGVHRTDRGRFALDEDGLLKPGKSAVVVVGRDDVEPTAYLCGLLNSELVDLWYTVRGRVPRDVWRDYEPIPMRRIPYRRPDGDVRATRIAELVREIALNRKKLLPHRPVVRTLERLLKDPWRTGPIEIDERALLEEVPAGAKISVRLDGTLELESGKRGKPKRHSSTVLQVGGARVSGNARRLDLLEELLDGKAPDDLGAVLLPKDSADFELQVEERRQLIQALLDEGRRLVEDVERLVCELYELSDDLTDEVVAHAVRRAQVAT